MAKKQTFDLASLAMEEGGRFTDQGKGPKLAKTRSRKASAADDLAALADAEDARTSGAVFSDAPLARATASKKAITKGGSYLPVARRSGLFARPVTKHEVRKRMDAWSYSRYKDWTQCPFKAFLKHVLRLKEPGSPAMDRGNHAHKAAEDFLTGKISWAQAQGQAKECGDKSRFGSKATPISLAPFEDDFRVAARSKPTVEEQWGFSTGWESVGWFGNRTWLRVKLDLCYSTGRVTMKVVDHKTGKVYADHAEQADLYALAVFIKFPQVQKIVVEYWYLDQGEKTTATFERVEMPELIKRWEEKVRPMMNDTVYPCRPGPYCRWCYHSKNTVGGTGKCEH